MALLLGFISTSISAYACATLRGPSPTSEDYIDSEQAVIVWDEAHKIEHFIRQAEIQTKDPDLGFLVPTPQPPQLVEVDPKIFQLAADVGRPKKVREVVYHTPLQVFGPILKGPAAVIYLPLVSLLTGMSDQSESDQPKIVSEQDIAGYHAVVLSADNAAGLALWLKQNDYAWTPQLEEWLKPYVFSKWFITAFKLSKPPPPNASVADKNKPIVSRAIRMSFSTDRPFFPYSEPGSKQRAHAASPYGRTLRVAVLSSNRMQGRLDDNRGWPGKLLFAGSPKPIAGTSWTAEDWLVFAKLEGQLFLPNTLTYWRDDSNPRPGTSDLYFSASPDQSAFRKTEIDYSLITLHLPDLSNPFSDVAGVVILVLLPCTPLYCGWWLIRLNHPRRTTISRSHLKSLPMFEVRRVFGFFAVLMGILYGVSCFAAAYLLHRLAVSYPGGYPLPALCDPVLLILVGMLFLTLVYCGIQAFHDEPTTDAPYAHRTVFGRYIDYAIAGGAFAIGLSFSLAMIIRFFVILLG